VLLSSVAECRRPTHRDERRLLLADPASSRVPTAALDAWVLETVAEAVAYAATLLRDRTAAEDVVQDCYCRLLQHADVYDLPRDGRKLLFRSITNACSNVRRRTRPALRLGATGARDDGPYRLELVDGSAFPAEEIAMGAELERAIGEGLAQIKRPQRAALELRSLGHSVEDVADLLGVSASHVRVMVHRARGALARHLAPFLDVPQPAMRGDRIAEPSRSKPTEEPPR
jgi:RNA polymerase sigma factor (sigma-70 family)